jgi:chemosensory pili system protein ChpA (sensor histidine kinase/response regulator)
VLLADDSRSIREAVAQILRGAGYSVDVAADGWEAWERLQLRSYDLLVTDLEMPRLHGHELIARCRSTPALRGLPIVVLTSRTAERSREAALHKGASGFIAKPINRRVVLEHIRSLLRPAAR